MAETTNTVDHVRVSQSSRRDAHQPPSLQFETYQAEWDHWVAEQKRIDSELSGYSKAAFAGKQAQIRRQYKADPNESFRQWMSCKASMEAKRQELVKEKMEVAEELLRIKPLLKVEKKRSVQQPKDTGPKAGDLMLVELRAIRVLLEQLLAGRGTNT